MTHSFSILFRDFFILLCRYYVMDGTEFPPHPRHVELELTSPLRDFIFGTWGCSEEAAADRGIWDWLKEIELFREKPWGQKSSVCLGACDACDFLMDSSQRKYQGTGFLHILPETESGNFMALPGKKCVPRISELWVELKHANVGCDNPRNMVKHC